MITKTLLAAIFPGTPKAKRERFVDALNKYMPMYGITTKLEAAAFLATGGVETDYLRVTTEYASGEDYEWRGDLGNTQKGDGVKFKGRGFFQTTGRYNYHRVNMRLRSKLKIDFLKTPERLAEIDIAVESACIFWVENNLSTYANAGQFKELSAVVNCGNPKKRPNHWTKRNELYSICVRRIPNDFGFTPDPIVSVSFQNGSVITTSDPAQMNPATSTTQTVPSATSGTDKPEDSFLTSAFDRNVSADTVKTAVPSLGRRVWRFLVRPLLALEVLLEAGNVAAWLGVIVALILIGLFIYWHRADIKRLFETLKRKFTE